MRRAIILTLLALAAGSRQAAFGRPADSLSVSDREIRVFSSAAGFRGAVWQNPALYYDYAPFSWTDIDVYGAYHDKGQAALKQEGNWDTRIGLDVNSFIRLSERDRVFGSAGYRHARQEQVVWNENADWQLLAPYVTGDSIGGFLKGETYYFNGGYARVWGDWTWGISGAYRAAHNYRDKDPRPRNTASDLSVTSGAGVRIRGYRLGFSAGFRFYRQTSEIAFLADKGSTSVYHPLGLGLDYVRFAGSHTGTKHQGLQWSGSLGLLPADTSKGLSASLSIDRLSMNKILSDANNLTLLTLNTTTLRGNLVWLRPLRPSEHYGLKLEADYSLRQGFENIYGEAGGNTYGDLITTAPGITISQTAVAAGGLWERLPLEQTAWGGAIEPKVAYQRLDLVYQTAAREAHLSSLTATLCARLQYRHRKLYLNAEANGGYAASLSARQSLPGLNPQKSADQTLLANLGYLSDSYGLIGLRLQGNYPIFKQFNLSLSLQWQMACYLKCGTTQYAAVSLGFFF